MLRALMGLELRCAGHRASAALPLQVPQSMYTVLLPAADRSAAPLVKDSLLDQKVLAQIQDPPATAAVDHSLSLTSICFLGDCRSEWLHFPYIAPLRNERPTTRRVQVGAIAMSCFASCLHLPTNTWRARFVPSLKFKGMTRAPSRLQSLAALAVNTPVPWRMHLEWLRWSCCRTLDLSAAKAR